MIAYQQLVESVATLEHNLGGNSTWTPDRVPEAIRRLVEPEPKHGNVQYFSVNNTTRDRTLAVIVSVGANFSQGPDALDIGVESALEPWRGPLEAVFDAYRRGVYRQWWSPSERRRLRLKLFSDLPIEIPRNYHYVMTNFSAWITKDPWSFLRGTEATEKLLLYSPGNVFWTDYLGLLREVLPGDTLWTGHGNWDVHAEFMKLVDRFELNRWLFSSNLTGNSLYSWLRKHCDP